tara:strand:- start:24757 stop:25170 length:414 start_codon:yes stop_codon:yes gene_type:complete
MKKSELKLMIRQIVREEVALTIKEVIAEIVQPTKNVTKQKKKIVEKKTYTSNSVLNDVLNETAQDGDWKTLGGKEFTTDRMSEIVGGNYADMMNNENSVSTPQQVSPSDPMAQFLNKDYRQVMQKVDEKDKRKRGVS